MNSAIILCAGKATRAKLNNNKVLFKLDEKTVLEKCIDAFLQSGCIDEIIVATNATDFNEISSLTLPYGNIKVVLGGQTRTKSVKAALKSVNGEIVLIHDGARPYVSKSIILSAIDCVKKHGSAITAIPSTDTLGFCENGKITATCRDGYYRIQTPQAFYTKDIMLAYEKAGDKDYTDDSAVFAEFIDKPHVVEGERTNVKLTHPEDFLPKTRVGVGFDLHRLVEGRKLILGGIEIPHTKGLLGHSDADVLTHAIMDALLSACALGDIGTHFPDTDPQYKGADSILLLKHVLKLISSNGYKPSNVSACIMAEKPKLMRHIPKITAMLSDVIQIEEKNIGLTCTTLEGIGIIGREEGIAVSASCTVVKK